MSRIPKNQPRTLAIILQAISETPCSRGCSVKSIVDKVQAYQMQNSNSKPRNVTVQVKRALSYGVETGLLLFRAGKYRLGVKDHRKKPMTRSSRLCKRKGNKKRVRRAPSYTSASGSSTEYSKSETSYESEPTDEEERKSSPRSSSRKRRRFALRNSRSIEKSVSNKRLRQSSYHEPSEGFTVHQPQIQPTSKCDNPDCLCNIKQEQGETADKNRSDEQSHRDEGCTN